MRSKFLARNSPKNLEFLLRNPKLTILNCHSMNDYDGMKKLKNKGFFRKETNFIDIKNGFN